MSAAVINLHPAAPPPAMPRMNVDAYVAAILKAANELLRNDLEVVCFMADVVSKMPVLWIKDTPTARRLIDAGCASYDRSGSDENGPFRIGCFARDGVQVQWFERVPS
jgi:hypothetical protein